LEQVKKESMSNCLTQAHLENASKLCICNLLTESKANTDNQGN